MKKLTKILALMLVVALVLSLVACGGGDSKKNAHKIDPNAPLSGSLTIFGNIASTEGEISVLDEEILKGFKEKYNVDVTIKGASQSGYLEQLQLAIASGEFPDVALFPTTTHETYIEACQKGKVVALDDYLFEENCPNLMKGTYPTAWEGVKPLDDGKIYAIPRTSITRNEGVVVRADWLKNVGMGDILDRTCHEVSAEEFKEILKRFTLDDPDNNPATKTLGYSCWLDGNKQFGPLEFTRGFYGDYGWYEYKGDDYKYMFPMYSQKTKIFKNEMQYTRDLQTAGYLSPDGPTFDASSKVNELFKTQKIGIDTAFVSAVASDEKSIIEANGGIPNPEGNYVDYIFAKDASGKVAGNGYYKPMWGQWVVFESCDNPNKFIKFCDYMLSDEVWTLVANGRENLTYFMDNGVRTPIEVPEGERARSCQFPSGIVRKAGDPDYFALRGISPVTEHMRPLVKENFYIGQATQVDSLDNGFNPAIASDEKFSLAQEELRQAVSNICAGKAEVSSYDAALAKWYKAGGKTYVEQMNKYIAENQKGENAPKVEKPLDPKEWNKAIEAARNAG
ncbi:MAG: extracellular solute-binding protein [Clostridia bacterium]|nr:extracellular solute-binding protein [Clostridia bacterium]